MSLSIDVIVGADKKLYYVPKLRTPKSKLSPIPEVRKPSPTPDFKYTNSGRIVKR